MGLNIEFCVRPISKFGRIFVKVKWCAKRVIQPLLHCHGHQFDLLILCPHPIAFTPGMFKKYSRNVRFSERICTIHDNTVAKALCNNLRSRV